MRARAMATTNEGPCFLGIQMFIGVEIIVILNFRSKARVVAQFRSSMLVSS